MKKIATVFGAAFLLFASSVFAQIGALPRPSEMVRAGAMQASGQHHPLNAIQAMHKGNFFGFTGGVTSFGPGSHFSKSWLQRDGLHTQLNAQFISVQDENPYTGNSLYGPNSSYTGNVMLLPIFFGVRRDLAYEQFKEAALPYLEAGVGPVLGFNFPYGRGFFGQFSHATTALTAGAFIGTGMDYSMGPKTVGTLNVRYNFIRFPGELAGRNDYSNLSISFGVFRALGR
ncbi:MAG: hypothetical protein H6695_12180 [Deferribacteres bacterium]|nr:hypothetical protein [candidate division KSB1 bacterium]MCB9510939.1 hypothetical protein [Deferribacteres bacterium]